MEDKQPESRDKADFRRHLRFPGFRVGPDRIAGARFSRVHEMAERPSYGEPSDPTSGHSPIRWWKLNGEDNDPGPGVGCLSALLVIGVFIMIPNAIGVLGSHFVLAPVWGAMFGIFIAGVLLSRSWKSRDGGPQWPSI